MNKLKYTVRYFCATYPFKNELSNARLTKLVYLADWESARLRSKQITDIDWYFNNYGPYVDDVMRVASSDERLMVQETQTAYGTKKILIGVNPNRKPGRMGQLDSNEKKILDSVIERTKMMFWNDFIRYVYSTYPVKNNARYTTLNLVEQANLEKCAAHNGGSEQNDEAAT